MAKKKAARKKAPTQRTKRSPAQKTEREKLLVKFERACDTAAKKREVNRPLRQEYRGNRRKRDWIRKRLIADLLKVFNDPRNPYEGWAASRKRYRELGNYPEIFVTDIFGTHAEFERAAGLRDKRGTSKVKNVTARLHTEKEIREYAEEVVMRHIGKWDKAYRERTGLKHILVGSDFHSQFVDPLALQVWMDVIEMVQPDGIVFNGDVVDFPKVGRYTQMPGAGNLSIQEELDFARDHILRPSIERCPTAWRTYHIGNHEQRMVRYIADSAPALASLRCLRWDTILDLDGLDLEIVFGGNWMAPTQKDRVNNIKRTYKVYYDSLLVNHGTSIAQNAWKVELDKAGMSITCGHTHRPGVFFGGTLASPNLTATHTGMMAGYAVGKDFSQVLDAANWTMGFSLFTIDAANGIVYPQPIHITEEGATFAGRFWRATDRTRKIRRAMWGEDGDVTAHIRRDAF